MSTKQPKIRIKLGPNASSFDSGLSGLSLHESEGNNEKEVDATVLENDTIVREAVKGGHLVIVDDGGTGTAALADGSPDKGGDKPTEEELENQGEGETDAEEEEEEEDDEAEEEEEDDDDDLTKTELIDAIRGAGDKVPAEETKGLNGKTKDDLFKIYKAYVKGK